MLSMNQESVTRPKNRQSKQAIMLIDGITIRMNYAETPSPNRIDTIEKMLLQSAGKHPIHTNN
jgi:hypothetical protein